MAGDDANPTQSRSTPHLTHFSYSHYPISPLTLAVFSLSSLIQFSASFAELAYMKNVLYEVMTLQSNVLVNNYL